MLMLITFAGQNVDNFRAFFPVQWPAIKKLLFFFPFFGTLNHTTAVKQFHDFGREERTDKFGIPKCLKIISLSLNFFA